MSFGWPGPRISFSVGRDVSAGDFHDDWILTHEMLHLCFPSLEEKHHWLEEGLATYCEPIARVRAGILPVDKMWHDVVEDSPQGQPEAGDRGLDHTHTWGRTYWGGAIFCLKADVTIRQRTGNKFGLEHALRGIAAAGGTIQNDWDIDRVIATGDRATGVPVLRELYDQMKDAPVKVDLPALWKQLGIQKRGETVVFDEGAPLAGVRRAIAGRE
jgi:hypothetical protein